MLLNRKKRRIMVHGRQIEKDKWGMTCPIGNGWYQSEPGHRCHMPRLEHLRKHARQGCYSRSGSAWIDTFRTSVNRSYSRLSSWETRRCTSARARDRGKTQVRWTVH